MFSIFKGWLGEKETQFNMWLRLGDEYKRFHNIILPSQNSTTQIDHIILSFYGIFVIETKNINGWIFGEEKSKYWTQCLYGKKYKFQNPLHQNYRHIKALSNFLEIDFKKIHSIVFFTGNNIELKTEFPDNVMTNGLSSYIKSYNNFIFSSQELNLFEKKLDEAKENGCSTSKHIENLNKRYSDNSICPKCGNKLIKRMAKRGSNAGNYFLGCSNYPKCKYTKNI